MNIDQIVAIVMALTASLWVGVAWGFMIGRNSERRRQALRAALKPAALDEPPQKALQDPELEIELDSAQFQSIRYDAIRHALLVKDSHGAHFLLPYPYGSLGWRSWPDCKPLGTTGPCSLSDDLETQLLRVGIPGVTSASDLVRYLCADGKPNSIRFVDSSEQIVATGYRTIERTQSV